MMRPPNSLVGEGVFYQNGTWAWSDLQKEGVKADMVGAIPIYMGLPGEEEKGLATGSGDNYWAINNKVSEADQQATKDFLKWVITSDKGKKAMTDDMGFVTPFKSFSDMKSSNPIVQADQEMADAGKQDVSWVRHYVHALPTVERRRRQCDARIRAGHRKWDDGEDRIR